VNDSLLFVTDLHFWEVVTNPLKLLNKRALGNFNVWLRRRHHFHMERAEAFADALLDTGIKTVMLGGDFTSTATEGEYALAARFVDGLEQRGLQIFLIAGNHDVYTFESVRKRRFEQYFGKYLPASGLPALQRLPGGTPLILVPTVCPNLLSSCGQVIAEVLESTIELIDGAPPGPLLISGHYPVLHETYAYQSGSSRQLRNADALRDAMGISGRDILYLSGHVHRFSYVQDSRYSNLKHLTTSAFFLERPGEDIGGGFSAIQVADGEVSVQNHFFDSEWHGEEVAAR
jgi:hypothetical protein